MRAPILMLFPAFCLVTSGCSSGPKQTHAGTQVLKVAPADLRTYPAIGFKATSSTNSADAELRQISTQVVAGLERGGEFKTIVNMTESPDKAAPLLLHFEITELRRVSSSDRFWTGAMAGPARISGKLVLKDSIADKILGEAVVTAYTDSNGVGSGTTEDAIARIAVEIIKYMTD